MALRFQAAPFVLVSLMTLSVPAGAGIPDPALSTIPNVLSVPGGLLPFTVTIVGDGGPVAAATVELRYTGVGEASACWCVGQPHPAVSAVTNGSGIAAFNVSGGGCLDPATIAGGVAVEVFVNDIKLKEIGQVSPDILLDPAGTCEVALSDAVQFTAPLSTGTFSYCFDLNSDGAVGLTDAVLFTSPAASAATCAE
jgi:hypothetical protein